MRVVFDFDDAFKALTGHARCFPWQRRLFEEWLSIGKPPSAVDIPTGLGKTSVMAIWLLARARGAALPRRLVYVVDRRAVVDQATHFAETLRENLTCKDLEPVRQSLDLDGRALPISTLRGRHVDNREWLEDPTAPAIVVGTVDMTGSRLLFSGYGVSRKMRPYHAGLIGADTLVVLDEAHLVPPFEKLLRSIEAREDGLGPRAGDECGIVPQFKLLSLSATGRDHEMGGATGVFRLCRGDHEDAIVKERLAARKRLTVHVFDDSKELVSELVERSWRLGTEPGPARVIVYCDRRDDALKVKREIDVRIKNSGFRKSEHDHPSELLVGGRRVFEREKLSEWLARQGFLGGDEEPPGAPKFLIATSAGEVGVDLDADHMVCDLVAWERMVQRLGRVNRRGKGNARIEVVAAPTKNKPKKDQEAAKWEKEWIERLARFRGPLDNLRDYSGEDSRDASPDGILDLKERAKNERKLQCAIETATSSEPLRPRLTRALVDAWSLTSLTKHTGRPEEIQPWLRGWEEDRTPQTTVIWRRHLPVCTPPRNATTGEIEAFFDAAPPHASETLESETHRVADWLVECGNKRLASKRSPSSDTRSHESSSDTPTTSVPRSREDVVGYVLSPARDLRSTLKGQDLENKEKLKNDILPGATLVVHARLGGLSPNGMLDPQIGTLPRVIDDEQEWLPEQDGKPVVRFRVRSVEDAQDPGHDEDWRERWSFAVERTEEGDITRQLVVEKWRHDAETEHDRAIGRVRTLADHHAQTKCKARILSEKVNLREPYAKMLAIAARLHDEGKRHDLWQRAASAPREGGPYAKTKGPMRFKQLGGYRHEFGSLAYAERDPEFQDLPQELKDLALHLIAAHHGWSRPVISAAGCDTPPSVLGERSREVGLRFARMQKRWGPWGLAWWEAMLRAADQQASRDNDKPRGNG